MELSRLSAGFAPGPKIKISSSRALNMVNALCPLRNVAGAIWQLGEKLL